MVRESRKTWLKLRMWIENVKDMRMCLMRKKVRMIKCEKHLVLLGNAKSEKCEKQSETKTQTDATLLSRKC